MSKTQADAAKEAFNRKLDKQAQDMVAKGRGTVDPTGLPTIGVDVRDERPPESANPIRRCYSLERQQGHWCVATIDYQDDKIVNITRTTPDLLPMAINEIKVRHGYLWSELQSGKKN
jgi:hypothetical protein